MCVYFRGSGGTLGIFGIFQGTLGIFGIRLQIKNMYVCMYRALYYGKIVTQASYVCIYVCMNVCMCLCDPGTHL